MNYHVNNMGCDDTTTFIIQLTESEYNAIKRSIEENNKNADSNCKPEIDLHHEGDCPGIRECTFARRLEDD